MTLLLLPVLLKVSNRTIKALTKGTFKALSQGTSKALSTFLVLAKRLRSFIKAVGKTFSYLSLFFCNLAF